jgi:hypothetical protein
MHRIESIKEIMGIDIFTIMNPDLDFVNWGDHFSCFQNAP